MPNCSDSVTLVTVVGMTAPCSEATIRVSPTAASWAGFITELLMVAPTGTKCLHGQHLVRASEAWSFVDRYDMY